MAITKIKPIRGTVNKALAYILDPKKTDDQLYVSSFGCAASDAAAKEFEWTRNLAVQQGMQMPKGSQGQLSTACFRPCSKSAYGFEL